MGSEMCIRDRSYLVDLISVMLCSSYNLRRNNNGFLLRHLSAYSKKTLGDRSFSRAAPKLWNNLSFEIRCSNSIVSFKSQLRTLYLRKLLIDTLLFLYIYLFIYLLYILI